jgi:hypothetical protein
MGAHFGKVLPLARHDLDVFPLALNINDVGEQYFDLFFSEHL